MIKLTLPEKPLELAENEVALTAEFKADNNRHVWKKDYITNALLQMSNNKCAYSEVKLNVNSTYLEVEHFKPKSLYPDDVVKWGNLLPSCKLCNDSKGDWDVVSDPIVNPLVDDPNEHLYIKGCRFYKKDQIGDNTIKAVSLNDNSQFVIPRFQVASDICDRLESSFDDLKTADSERKIRNQVRRITQILKMCLPTEAYSAAVSTYLLYDSPVFRELKAYLLSSKLWTDELDEISKILSSIALPVERI